MADKKSGNRTYYHYTSYGGATGIAESGKVHESTETGRDAAFGEGVYLTTKSPRTSTTGQIAHNNYDDGSSYSQSQQHKTQVAVEFKIPRGEVQKHGRGRDVHTYSGDLNVNKYGTGNMYAANQDGPYSKIKGGKSGK